MTKLSWKEQIFVGITLFSMFFGAGNLIFPPLLGAQAGSNIIPAFIGFVISAVGFPILGVAAAARSGGLRTLSERVGKKFSFVFTIIVYLSIGPCLAIPRTASTSFEMAVTPFVGEVSITMRIIYSFVFFGIALLLAFNPSKLIDRLGKKLAPTLIILIAILFVGSLINGITPSQAVNEHYATSAAAVGFIDGYQTMDAIASLIFGIVLSINIQNKGIEKNDDIVKCIIKAGYIATIIFVCVYGALSYIGTAGSVDAQNGAEILSAVANSLFGNIGMVMIAAIFVIACLNTCIGLICSCSEYFNEIVPSISYKKWVIILAIFSTIVSNVGLNTILKFSIPLLSCIYPIVIVIILLAFLPKSTLNRPYIYPFTVIFAGVVGVIQALNIPGLSTVVSVLPFYDMGLGWILPAIIGGLIGFVVKKKETI